MDSTGNIRLYKKQLKQIQKVIDDIYSTRSILRMNPGNESIIDNLDKQEEGIERLLNSFGYTISLGWIVEKWHCA